MKKSFFLSVIFLLFILYYFLFPLTADREYIWLPQFQSDLNDLDGCSLAVLKDSVCIRTTTLTGVLNPDGESIINRDENRIKTYSGSHTFESKGDFVSVLRNRINNKYAIFEGAGSPLILNEHYLLADFPSSLIKEVSTTGDILWSWEGVSPITALSASTMNVVFGTLDGKVYLFRKDGSQRVFEPLKDRNDSVIYGLSISQEGSRLAVVAGLDNQHLVIYSELTTLKYVESARFELDSHYARPVTLFASDLSFSVWVEQPGELVRYTRRGVETRYPFDGELLTMVPDEKEGLIHILCRSDSGESRLSILSLEGRLLLSEKMSDVPRYFKYFENQFSLLVGQDSFILIDRKEY